MNVSMCRKPCQIRRPALAALLLVLALEPPAAAVAEPAAPPLRRYSLASAVEALVTHNLSVVAARHHVDLFRAQRLAAALKPETTIVVTATDVVIPRVFTHPRYAGLAVADEAVLDTTYTIDVERLVERGGKRELRMRHAAIGTDVAEAQVVDELRRQVFELTQAFFGALLARENVQVVSENLRDFSRIEQLFATQVEEGYTAGVDLRRIGLELVDLQGDVSAAHLDYVQSLRDVLNLVGEGEVALAERSLLAATSTPPSSPAGDQPDTALLNLVEGDLTMHPVETDLETLRALALTHRPDLRAAELELEAADAQVRLARAERTRDITIGAQYARAGPDNAVGVGIGIPLTTARRAEAAAAQATAARQQAKARWRRVRAQVITDVEKAFMAYRISRDRLSLFDAQIVRRASEVRDIEQVAYREGERGLLSFLDAQRVYNQTLVAYNQARHDVAVSAHQLAWATGTDLARLTRAPAEARPAGAHHE